MRVETNLTTPLTKARLSPLDKPTIACILSLLLFTASYWLLRLILDADWWIMSYESHGCCSTAPVSLNSSLCSCEDFCSHISGC